MEAAVILPERENKILKEKYNRLIDLYFALQKENEHLKNQNFSLTNELEAIAGELEELEKMQEELKSYTADTPELIEKNLLEFFSSFFTVIRKALDEGAFIPYSYASKNAKNYLKIEKNTFEQIINDNSSVPLKEFREYSAGFMLIRSENNKYVFTNDKQTVYYVNRSILNCMTANPADALAAVENH